MLVPSAENARHFTIMNEWFQGFRDIFKSPLQLRATIASCFRCSADPAPYILLSVNPEEHLPMMQVDAAQILSAALFDAVNRRFAVNHLADNGL